MLINFFLQYFRDFIEQELEKFEDAFDVTDGGHGEAAVNMKPTREVTQPGIVKFGTTYYFISGSKSIFLLNMDTTREEYAIKLTEEELNELPENIIYTGTQEVFDANHEDAFRLLTMIIGSMNKMQEDFYSFPLASFIIHLSGYMYNEIQEVQNGFMTSIVVSGAGNTCRTGKSLMTNIWQLVFQGHKAQDQGISITMSALFSKLDKGIPYFSKYFWLA